MPIHTHFTYWLLLWYIIYVVLSVFTKFVIPNPFWWIVLAACVNAILVLYTFFIILRGDVSNDKQTWLTIGLYILTNTIVKVLPILSLHFDWFNTNERQKTTQSLYKSLLLGLVLFLLWIGWWLYSDRYAMDQSWWQRKRMRGVLENDGPVVSRLKNALTW